MIRGAVEKFDRRSLSGPEMGLHSYSFDKRHRFANKHPRRAAEAA
jgi:hypothetical protein